MSISKKHGTVLVVSAALLLAIWPLPNTIALRHLALLSGFFAAVFVLQANAELFRFKKAWPVYLFFCSFIWVALHFAIPSDHRAEQWRELTGDWLRNFLASAVGISLGILLNEPNKYLSSFMQRTKDTFLLWGLAGTTCIFVIRYLYEVFQSETWIHFDFYMAPYLGKTPLVVFGGLLTPVLLIKFLGALKGRLSFFWYIYSFLGLSATLLMYYFANTKNGVAMFLFLVSTALLAALKDILRSKSSLLIFALFALIGVLAFGYIIDKHLKSNPAWSNIVSDFKASVKISEHSYWKDKVSPIPTNENGVSVNVSTYERAAWGRAGLELLIENPLGYGLINHSFGALAIQKWRDFHAPEGSNRGSTHSGWLDFALGFGIPGLLMISIPLTTSYLRVRRRTDFWGSYATWTIPLIGIIFLTTEVCTGHFIELLFFLTALFCGLTLQDGRGTIAKHEA